LLLVQWESIAAHRDGFRQSADYAAWKARLHGYYDCLPEVNYYGKSIFDA
jgi:heme-degrading monooxygenase HmoA